MFDADQNLIISRIATLNGEVFLATGQTFFVHADEQRQLCLIGTSQLDF